MDWLEICSEETLSETFIEEHKDEVDWHYISDYQVLSEGFIEKFHDRINWTIISKKQILSEAFIHRYREKLDWMYISNFQNLSFPFLMRHITYIHLPAIQKNDYNPPLRKEEMKQVEDSFWSYWKNRFQLSPNPSFSKKNMITITSPPWENEHTPSFECVYTISNDHIHTIQLEFFVQTTKGDLFPINEVNFQNKHEEYMFQQVLKQFLIETGVIENIELFFTNSHNSFL